MECASEAAAKRQFEGFAARGSAKSFLMAAE
jgi:hypothetical protein